jgi:hypothetical protein
MMRVLALLLVAGTVCVWAQQVDPWDHALVVYWLTPAQEAAFDATDGVISGFWTNDWDGRDYIEMNTDDNHNPTTVAFTGPTDAEFVVKAGGSCRGLYLYCSAMDNVWVDRSSPTDYGADAVDLYLDNMSSGEIANCTDCYVGLYNTTLTFTTQQFQVYMGGASLPTGLRFAHYDNSLWSWTTEDDLTWSEANSAYGFGFDVVHEDQAHKVQEWFIPWASVGNGGLAAVPSPGTHLGFTGGYNDKDGDDPNCSEMRWLGQDPWASDAQQVQYWGDLVMSGEFVAGPVCGGPVHRPVRTRSPLAYGDLGRDGGVFTLRGERIHGGAGPGVLIAGARGRGGARVLRLHYSPSR